MRFVLGFYSNRFLFSLGGCKFVAEILCEIPVSNDRSAGCCVHASRRKGVHKLIGMMPMIWMMSLIMHAQGNSKARRQWQGEDVDLSYSSRHESQQPIPLLMNCQPGTSHYLIILARHFGG
ncbi:PREDICTED: uncharacterized protein LOC109192689 [Ipomoea nil]|uniref:uncharacterized protein LOC109192689 n=1 Tax=Ipomoea nil TaxID=35883 RepID=UPI000901DF25|nr:PREDICTED: uncharacterized protein LOC109192689 [Ipomoea nil]